MVGVVVAGMTALYMFRATALTFWGEYQGGEDPPAGHGDPGAAAGHGDAHGEPHESPRSMTVPLVSSRSPP